MEAFTYASLFTLILFIAASTGELWIETRFGRFLGRIFAGIVHAFDEAWFWATRRRGD